MVAFGLGMLTLTVIGQGRGGHYLRMVFDSLSPPLVSL